MGVPRYLLITFPGFSVVNLPLSGRISKCFFTTTLIPHAFMLLRNNHPIVSGKILNDFNI
jgi:hypothetical protein